MTEEIEANKVVINNSERFGGNLKTFIVNVEKEAANASKPNTVEISLDRKKNTYNLTAKSDNSGYEYRLDVSNLGEGSHVFEVSVIDEAGNEFIKIDDEGNRKTVQKIQQIITDRTRQRTRNRRMSCASHLPRMPLPRRRRSQGKHQTEARTDTRISPRPSVHGWTGRCRSGPLPRP